MATLDFIPNKEERDMFDYIVPGTVTVPYDQSMADLIWSGKASEWMDDYGGGKHPSKWNPFKTDMNPLMHPYKVLLGNGDGRSTSCVPVIRNLDRRSKDYKKMPWDESISPNNKEDIRRIYFNHCTAVFNAFNENPISIFDGSFNNIGELCPSQRFVNPQNLDEFRLFLEVPVWQTYKRAYWFYINPYPERPEVYHLVKVSQENLLNVKYEMCKTGVIGGYRSFREGNGRKPIVMCSFRSDEYYASDSNIRYHKGITVYSFDVRQCRTIRKPTDKEFAPIAKHTCIETNENAESVVSSLSKFSPVIYRTMSSGGTPFEWKVGVLSDIRIEKEEIDHGQSPFSSCTGKFIHKRLVISLVGDPRNYIITEAYPFREELEKYVDTNEDIPYEERYRKEEYSKIKEINVAWLLPCCL